MRHPLLEVHQSDTVGCLARFMAEHDGADRIIGEAAKVGTCLHRVAEGLSTWREGRAAADPTTMAFTLLREHALSLRLSPMAVTDALSILETVLAPNSRISLWPAMGWSGKAEARWGLVGDATFLTAIEDPKGECYAAGTMDLLEWSGGKRLLRVSDWKTTLVMLSAEDAWNSWQGRLYSYAALRLPGFEQAESVTFRLVLLRHGYSVEAEFRRGDPWERGVEERLHAIRASRERALAAEEWPETLGPWCEWCPVMARCGEQQRAGWIGNEGLATMPLPEAARTMLALEARAKTLRKRVRAAVESSGDPIPLGDAHGTVLGFQATTGVETMLSYEQTMDALRLYGMTDAQFVEHFRFVGPQHYPSRVKKVLREVLGVDEATAEGLVIPVTKSEFTAHVPERVLEPTRPATIEDIDRLLGGTDG